MHVGFEAGNLILWVKLELHTCDVQVKPPSVRVFLRVPLSLIPKAPVPKPTSFFTPFAKAVRIIKLFKNQLGRAFASSMMASGLKISLP